MSETGPADPRGVGRVVSGAGEVIDTAAGWVNHPVDGLRRATPEERARFPAAREWERARHTRERDKGALDGKMWRAILRGLVEELQSLGVAVDPARLRRRILDARDDEG